MATSEAPKKTARYAQGPVALRNADALAVRRRDKPPPYRNIAGIVVSAMRTWIDPAAVCRDPLGAVRSRDGPISSGLSGSALPLGAQQPFAGRAQRAPDKRLRQEQDSTGTESRGIKQMILQESFRSVCE